MPDLTARGERIILPPEPASAGRARTFVADALRALDRSTLIETAQLAVSELVTNAVLHANTEVEVVVVATAGGALIEVSDRHPGLPAARRYGEYATTGRGLGLLGALADEVGIEPLEPSGKRIWFTLSAELQRDEESLIAAWDLDALLDADEQVGASTAPAFLLHRLPVVLWTAAQQHHDAVLRELAMYRAAHPPGADDADLSAARQAEAALASAVDLALSRAAADLSRETALPEGHPSPLAASGTSVDVEVAYPGDTAALFAALQDVLDEAERLAARGLLLVRPALPEVVALRDWACEQAVAQANGVPPAAWAGVDREVFARGDSARFQTPAPVWDASVVTDSDRCALAADDNNRLVAVSRPAAELVGWSVSDLVGRRVVTLVPHRYREAHVAGFTRHLTTGEAHALDVELDLPVLCADGREVICTFVITHVAAASGRSVYVSWLTPPAD